MFNWLISFLLPFPAPFAMRSSRWRRYIASSGGLTTIGLNVAVRSVRRSICAVIACVNWLLWQTIFPTHSGYQLLRKCTKLFQSLFHILIVIRIYPLPECLYGLIACPHMITDTERAFGSGYCLKPLILQAYFSDPASIEFYSIEMTLPSRNCRIHPAKVERRKLLPSINGWHPMRFTTFCKVKPDVVEH